MDVDAKHVAAVRKSMDSVLSRLSALDAELPAQGTDTTTDQCEETSICAAIYDLGNAASPGTKMGSFLPSTARFVEACELGTGYQGVVVKARDSVTGETVAVKTLHPKPLYFADSDEELEEDELAYRVLREACFMAACRGHTSLVNLSAVGRHPRTGQYCLVMEHVGARSLHDVLVDQRRRKPFPERDVRRMMRQVLSGAKAMHDRGVVHRAIDSTNILVGDGGNAVKIGDFGAATSTSETGAGSASRLSHYPPECMLEPMGAKNDKAMDAWSMGCLMLELLTGQDLFEVGVDNDYEDQLQNIDDVLGLSDKRIMEAVKHAVDVDLPPEVQRNRVQRRGGRLRELVPREVLSDLGLNVLQGLLMYNPKARLTAADALQHPWFTDNTDDDSPSVSVSRVFIGVLALLFLMAFVCLRYWW